MTKVSITVNTEIEIGTLSLSESLWSIHEEDKEKERIVGREGRYHHMQDSALHLQSFEGLDMNLEFSRLWNKAIVIPTPLPVLNLGSPQNQLWFK